MVLARFPIGNFKISFSFSYVSCRLRTLFGRNTTASAVPRAVVIPDVEHLRVLLKHELVTGSPLGELLKMGEMAPFLCWLLGNIFKVWILCRSPHFFDLAQVGSRQEIRPFSYNAIAKVDYGDHFKATFYSNFGHFRP